MAVLNVINGPDSGQQFPLKGECSLIGRHRDCAIVLDFSAVSARHAQINQVGDDYYVEDLNSRNGTFVNGQRLQRRHLLRNNDRLRICDTLFSFHQEPFGPTPALLMVDDPDDSSVVKATLDVSSSHTRLRAGINAEDKLHAIIGMIENLGSTLVVDDVLPKILDSVFEIFAQADHGFVVLKDPDTGSLALKAGKHRRAGGPETVRVSLTIIHRAMTSKEAILSVDAATDERFEKSKSVADLHIRSMMCVPLIDSQAQALGAIQLETRDQDSHFQQGDLDVLASIARLTTFAIANAQLHETLLHQQATQRDLMLARQVQRGFLPQARPSIRGYDFFEFYEPAHQVGGDYYDYIHLPGERLAVVVADVSGKGIPAALLMARLSAEVRYCLASDRRPAEAVNRLNAAFLASGPDDHIVTIMLAVIAPNEDEVTIVNAGHVGPLVRRADGKVEAVSEDQRGLPIGVAAEESYRQSPLRLAPGETLIAFTDGVTDARNPRGDFFGIKRLYARLADTADNASALGRGILADVTNFVASERQTDDMCLVCIRRV